MYKIKKRSQPVQAPVLYNIIEDYTEYDAPGNVTVCAMTHPEDLELHATVLAEAYEIPVERMRSLLANGGVHVYEQGGPLVTRGTFVCLVDPTGRVPKQTWTL